jgi:hypothetical protein
MKMKKPDDTLSGKKNAALCGVTYGGGATQNAQRPTSHSMQNKSFSITSAPSLILSVPSSVLLTLTRSAGF